MNVINAECLNCTDGTVHEYVATDTDTNGQSLREADKQHLIGNTIQILDKINLKEGCHIAFRQNLQIFEGWVNGAMCEVFAMTPYCIWYAEFGFQIKNTLSQDLNKILKSKVLHVH